MASFVLDAFKGLSEDDLRRKCRQLVRSNMKKDLLICALIKFGSVDAMPSPLAAQVREIISIYREE